MKVYEYKLTSSHAAQELKHKLRGLSLKHFTQSPVTSIISMQKTIITPVNFPKRE
jgi:hypothetical protein